MPTQKPKFYFMQNYFKLPHHQAIANKPISFDYAKRNFSGVTTTKDEKVPEDSEQVLHVL